MNNIYVDELPKGCVNCDFGYANNFCEIDYEIDIRNFDKNQKHPNCPLKPLTDRLAEERKKVVQEIKDKLLYCTEIHIEKYNAFYYKGDEVDEILDQIERGE